jgi:hypothetical protein
MKPNNEAPMYSATNPKNEIAAHIFRFLYAIMLLLILYSDIWSSRELPEELVDFAILAFIMHLINHWAVRGISYLLMVFIVVLFIMELFIMYAERR